MRSRRLIGGLSIVVALILWEVCARAFGISSVILPTPSEVFRELSESSGYLLKHAYVTATEATSGFLLAVTAAIMLGIPVALSPVANAILTPHIVVSQAFPKAALAPLLIIWFGYGMQSKILVAGAISFFPVFTALTYGLTSVPKELDELFDALDATKASRLWRLQIPFAIPYVVASLKMATVYSLVGAISAEFINPDKGLGYVLIVCENNLNTTLLFAALIISGMLGLIAWCLARSLLIAVQKKMRIYTLSYDGG